MNINKNEGFSLIEVIVSVSVLSILLLAIPNLMLNVENLKEEYKYEINVNKFAQEILDKAISEDQILLNEKIKLGNDFFYTVNKKDYNANLNQYIFTFNKNTKNKQVILLKPKQ